MNNREIQQFWYIKNIISSFFFFFLSLPKMYGWVRVRERESKMTQIYTQRSRRYRSSVKPLRLSALRVEISLVIWYSGRPRKFSRLYHLQPATYSLHVDTPPSSAPPTQILVVIPLVHVITLLSRTLPSRTPPTQFTQHFRQNTYVLFTLGTRCISCFCSYCPTTF